MYICLLIQKIALARKNAAVKDTAQKIKIDSDTSGFKKIATDAKIAKDSINPLVSSIGTLKTALISLGSIAAIKSFVALNDEIANLKVRIKLVTKDINEAKFAWSSLYEISDKAGVAFRTTADSFSKMGIALKGHEVGAGIIADLSEIANQTIAISGAPLQNATAGLFQFTQALGMGRFEAQELNSILENIPMLAQQIAAGLSKMYKKNIQASDLRGDYRLLPAQEAIKALLIQQAEVNSLFEQMPNTAEKGFARVKNAVFKAVDSFDELTNMSRKIGDMFTDLAKYLSSPQVQYSFKQWAITFEFAVDNIVAPAIFGLTSLFSKSVSGWEILFTNFFSFLVYSWLQTTNKMRFYFQQLSADFEALRSIQSEGIALIKTPFKTSSGIKNDLKESIKDTENLIKKKKELIAIAQKEGKGNTPYAKVQETALNLEEIKLKRLNNSLGKYSESTKNYQNNNKQLQRYIMEI